MSPAADPAAALRTALLRRRILVVGGAGGVGKTTTAAALSLQAALLGRRVLVCTIDPSRRLVTSLGLDRLGERPQLLDLDRFRSASSPPGGALWAMTLDTKRTFDALVERYASGEARSRILDNRFYQQVSSALSGSHEYMAMEKLLELSADRRYDLVVLDTPPTRHALDFLDAPERLMGFLDTSTLHWVLRPYFVAGRLTLKVATRTGRMALSMADKVLGLKFLQDLSEFFLAFEGMYDGFKRRAAEVQQLLRRPESGFVLVASASRVTLEEALYFHRRLVEREMPFVSFVVNRVHPDPSAAASGRRTAARLDAALAARLVEVFRDQQKLARADLANVAWLEKESGERMVLVPEQEADVHDLRGLHEIAQTIFGAGGRKGWPQRAAARRSEKDRTARAARTTRTSGAAAAPAGSRKRE